MSREKWSLPLGARVGVLLVVLVAALLPFVLTGDVASWAALLFFPLILVVGIVAMVAEWVTRDRTDKPRTEGTETGRRAAGVALAGVVLILTVWTALPDHKSGSPRVPRSGDMERQTQHLLDQLRSCRSSQKECERQIVSGVTHPGKAGTGGGD
jgi:hypothetical protein